MRLGWAAEFTSSLHTFQDRLGETRRDARIDFIFIITNWTCTSGRCGTSNKNSRGRLVHRYLHLKYGPKAGRIILPVLKCPVLILESEAKPLCPLYMG